MRRTFWFLILVLVASSAMAADDLPVTVKVGGTLFSEFTQTTGDVDRPSAFQLTRAYVNVTGTVTKSVSFRITPDFAKDNGRMKFAYVQLNHDQLWLRAGIQQTPYLDVVEAVYRYRFQGTSFTEREGFLTSADNGVSVHYNFLGDRADVHAGYYNGEGYAKAETNDHKAFQIRASYRPIKPLRITGFAVLDQASSSVSRDRFVLTTSYEHARGNAGVDFISARDAVTSRGWSAWATPKLGHGFEVLLRYDSMTSPDSHSRDIAGVAYWMNGPKGTTAAVLVDRDHASLSTGLDDTRYGVKFVLAF